MRSRGAGRWTGISWGESCPDRPLRLLTHCNTGRLATAAVGTALGVILELARRGRVADVLVNETRPLLQGARLTMWELREAGVPCRLQVDSAAATAMAQGLVDCVLVGADRIAGNGDFANKVGTYAVALAAAAHDVPMIVVAPESTWDTSLPDGRGIVVEQREPAEVLAVAGVATAPAGSAVHNPGFDVTPAHLVTALVSQRRTVRPGRPDPGSGAMADRIAAALATFPDYPKPGVSFRDLAGVYAEPGLLEDAAQHVVDLLGTGFDRVVAIESRGFVLGAVLAAKARVPLTLARKAGKLPGAVHRARYTLEYGDDALELQQNTVTPGERVVCVDDVLATGGTLGAAAELVDAAGGTVTGMVVLLALDGLDGRQRLERHRLLTLCEVPA
ncbi:adenine phosphoribosyltransferase [Micromonospora sp. ALFpr18c]|uniref:adenine phosphoribosyltransferase n=1 Tax=Micromonospora sp. ALFpr18c TaxID=1458665 RepID=UPI00124B8CDF|nr:adenine phosphoribosyltransferase [Micromonospora sp. ALFpr18c]KAB1935306.1 adenine phosphoribosyltransferase [Micromonospora sp. ALFpr18c]